MNNIKDKIESSINREKKVIQNFYSQKDFEDWHLSTLSKLFSDLGYFYLITDEISKSRNAFNTVGYIDIYLTEKYSKSHSRFLEFDIPRCLLPILSDNEILIQSYSKLRFQKTEGNELSMDDMVSKGESPIWCNTIQFLMGKNFEGVRRNLNILETITLPKLSKKEELLRIDYEFYKALLEKDKNKCEEILDQLVSPKIHKKRNDNPVLNQYVSQPALGYAKLAWRHGVEVEVNSTLVPKELLPIVTLDHYEIPYDFLKT